MSNQYWEDFSPAGLNTASAPAAEAENSRSFGQVLSDIAVGALEGYAKGGGRGAIAGGILGGIRGEDPARQIEQDNARLRNDLLKQQLQFNAESHQDTRELRKEQIANARNEKKQQALQFAALQRRSDAMQIEAWAKEYDNEFQKISDSLNLFGRTLLKNDPGYQGQKAAYVIMRAAETNPRLAQEAAARAGWNLQMDGDKIVGLVANDGSNRSLKYDRSSMKMIMGFLNERFRNGITAAMALGQDAQNMEQFAIKNTLLDNKVKKVFTEANGNVDYGSAYEAYYKFIRNNSKDFSDADMIGHQLNITLQAALVDGAISQQEMAVLIPQVQARFKDLGCDIIAPDGNPKNAKVKFANGTEIDILKFAQGLKERDTVMSAWRADLAKIQADKAKKAMVAAEQALKHRKLNAETVKAEQEAGIGANGAAGNAEDTANWGNEEKALYNVGQKKAQELNVKIPEIEGKNKADATLTFGVAYNQAEQVFVETGDYGKAQKKLASELEDVGWKESQIPDLFGDKAEKQQIEMLEKRNRFLRDRLNAKREKGEYKSEMVTTAELPNATDIDRAIPVGVRIEDADTREYKRNIDRISELRSKQFTRMKNKKQAAEYSKRYPKKAEELAKAAADRR